MYALREVDRAGNDYEIFEHADFAFVCEQAVAAKRARPGYAFYIVNPDLADVDFDGLTEEEREILP